VRRQEPRAVTIHTPGFLFTTPALNPSERGNDDGGDRDHECGHMHSSYDVVIGRAVSSLFLNGYVKVSEKGFSRA
jgi:hypothetical protein